MQRVALRLHLCKQRDHACLAQPHREHHAVVAGIQRNVAPRQRLPRRAQAHSRRRTLLAVHAHGHGHRLVAPQGVGQLQRFDPGIAARLRRGREREHAHTLRPQARQRPPDIAMGLIAVGEQHHPLHPVRVQAEQRLVERPLEVGGALVEQARAIGLRRIAHRDLLHIFHARNRSRPLREYHVANGVGLGLRIGPLHELQRRLHEAARHAARDVQRVDHRYLRSRRRPDRPQQRQDDEHQRGTAQNRGHREVSSRQGGARAHGRPPHQRQQDEQPERPERAYANRAHALLRDARHETRGARRGARPEPPHPRPLPRSRGRGGLPFHSPRLTSRPLDSRLPSPPSHTVRRRLNVHHSAASSNTASTSSRIQGSVASGGVA